MLILKIFLIFLGVVFLLALIPVIIFSDLRTLLIFKINPIYIRNKCIHKLTRDGEELYYLGSIHGFHLKSKEFSLLHVKAVLENLMPDLLLVESRQEELDAGNLADGPIEMFYSHLAARSYGILVRGVDWWSLDENKITLTYKKRDDIISENILANAPGHKKVLVITGLAHMLEGIPRIKKQGYIECQLSRQEKDKLFMHADKEVIFPEGTEKYIGIRIDKEKKLLNSSVQDEKKLQRMKRGIENLERFKIKLEESTLHI